MNFILKKSIDVLNIGEPANSRPVTVKADDLRSTLLVSNDFFAVYKWEITGKVDFEKTADYSLLSVLAGQGQLTVDGKNYPIQKAATLSYQVMLKLGLWKGKVWN